MRIFKLPLLALVLCFMFACTEKEDTPAPSNQLKGNWKVTDISYTGNSVTTMDGYSFANSFIGTGYDLNLNINMDENPNNYTSSGDYSIKVTSEMNGQTFTQNWTNQSFMDAGTWAREADELIFETKSNGSQRSTILELTNTTLRIGYNSTQTTSQDGTTVTATIVGTYTFTRQ